MSPRSARSLRSFSGWVFGLATSVLLISVWGRAVVIDSDELSDNLRPLGQSEQVSGLFVDWLTDELVEAGIPESQAADATDLAMATPEVQSAMGELVEEVVVAAAAPGLGPATVDVSSVLTPSVPAVTDAVVTAGVPVTEPQVAAVVGGLDPLVIREAGVAPFVGDTSPVASRLGLATLVAALVMLVFGMVYLSASPVRLNAARTLFVRFAVGALSFAVLLKLGSWILDPQGGRAPISESLSMIADSQWVLPAIIGTFAAIAAVIVWLAKLGTPQERPAQQVRPGGGSPPTSGAARQLSG